MKIKCWGCRGSLPTPGKTTVEFGGNTTCFQVDGTNGELVIIDAGSGIRPLGQHIMKNDERKSFSLLLTHAHWDHLMGFPFFIPAYIKKFDMKIYGDFGASKKLKEVIAHQFKAPYFPVKFRELQADISFVELSPRPIKIGDIKVESIKLSHPGGGTGYRFTDKNKRFVFLTDNELGYAHPEGYSFSKYVQFAKGADLLLHDAQYTEEEYIRLNKTWGHSTFDQAYELALQAGVKRLGFCHHDQERSDKMLRMIEKKFMRRSSKLKVFAVREGASFSL
jgi:phosphoribosyl 1,2-cyclic phosphodiesterase